MLLSTPLWAGTPVAIVGGAKAYLSSPSIGTTGPTQTITLTFNANGNPSGTSSALNSLGISGPNSADFAIVGGTCNPGTTQLNSGNPTCTVIVQYKASSAAAESATLTGNCTQVNVIGGFTLSCTSATGNLTSLSGALLAALVSTPMLDPKLLTALCALLLAIGVYFASRKRI